MATAPSPTLPPDEREALLNAWLDQITGLVRTVDAWATADGWATRTITKKMEDREIGDHRVPALLLQKETVRIILDPKGREALGGVEGVADFYLMPAYDDIVTLYYFKGGWKIDYPRAMSERLGIPWDFDELIRNEFTREAFITILNELVRDAS